MGWDRVAAMVAMGRPLLLPGGALALLPMAMLVLVHLLGIHWADREADAAVGLLLAPPASLWAAVTFVQRPSPVPSTLAMATGLVAAAVGWIVAAG